MASYKQTRALLQTSAVAHLRSEIQSRYKLEQRMQRFVSAHQDLKQTSCVCFVFCTCLFGVHFE